MSQTAICKMGIIKPNYISPTAVEVVTFLNVREVLNITFYQDSSQLPNKKKNDIFIIRFIFTLNLKRNPLFGLQTLLSLILIQQMILPRLYDFVSSWSVRKLVLSLTVMTDTTSEQQLVNNNYFKHALNNVFFIIWGVFFFLFWFTIWAFSFWCNDHKLFGSFSK